MSVASIRNKILEAFGGSWTQAFGSGVHAKRAASAVAKGINDSIGDEITAPPIGTMMAWHKSLSGTPALPSNWAELNGQTISDADSPYDGVTLPNFNGDGRFMRGGATSGTEQAGSIGTHDHTVSNHTHSTPSHQHLMPIGFDDGNNIYYYQDNPGYGSQIFSSAQHHPGTIASATVGSIRLAETRNDGGGTTGGASPGTGTQTNQSGEIRPDAMTAVWIIRIK